MAISKFSIFPPEFAKPPPPFRRQHLSVSIYKTTCFTAVRTFVGVTCPSAAPANRRCFRPPNAVRKVVDRCLCWWNISGSEEEAGSEEAKPITVTVALNRMWLLIGNDKWIIYLALGSLVIAAISEISMPKILAESIFSAQRCESARFFRSSRLLLILCITSGISRLFAGGLRGAGFAVANTVLVKRLRETLYAAIVYQDITFFEMETVGGLTSRLGTDCQRLSYVIGNDLHLILRNLIQGIGALLNLMALSWPLSLPAVMTCLALSIIVSVYGRYQKKTAQLIQKFNACANSISQETFSMIRTVRVNRTEVEEIERYKQCLDKSAFVNIRESAAYGLWNMSFYMLYRSTQVLAVLLGGISLLNSQASSEQLTKYVLYCEWLIYATWRVVDNFSSLLQSIGANERVFQLMELFPSDQFLSEGVELRRLVGNLQFTEVSFSYPSRMEVPVLDHISLTVEANQVAAIVGLSGSGKSTLVNLLLRVYEPTNGQIYIDGYPLRELDIKWLRQSIGYVGQEPHLFNLDIKSNITYGCPKDVTDADIELAAKQAYAHEFISSLPDGYNTVVDDDLLSGGQKQRIAISRALLRDPTILILDEPTSALDPDSEYHVKRILNTFRNDNTTERTVIVIAHRLSTIRDADKIIVMDGGGIAEMGGHDDLVKKGGLYARLTSSQEQDLA